MSEQSIIRVGVIGTGGMARGGHIIGMLKQTDTTSIDYVCEPDANAYELTCEMFEKAKLPVPANEPDLDKFLAEYADKLDVVLIVTPHNVHFEQAKKCMEAGLDVLLEKPMVMNAEEAKQLIEVRDQTGKLLVVAFNGSMSPAVRTASAKLRAGELGEVLSISATVWQSWRKPTTSTWRQDPIVAGGGFLFDTGAHMLNTVVDLAGEPFTEVAAWMDNRGTPVDILGVVIGKLKSGAMVTLHGSGDTTAIGSDVRVFGTKGFLITGVWGGSLSMQLEGEKTPTPVALPESLGTWQQFVAVCRGQMANPCPPEVGLRMARLWDAIQASAAKNGQPVAVSS
jgi:predicted dehydrogenase